MRAVLMLMLALVLIAPTTVQSSDYGLLRYRNRCSDSPRRDFNRRVPPKSYNYPDKHDYGFDPVPPSIRIAPGFRDNHYWRLGGWYYGQGDYSPGYDGMLWFGYEIEY